MASTKLIGTAPDQVPTNADLGSMAFQDRESVNFLDGRGGLQHLDVTAISQQLGLGGVTSVFVYDTSKDSDGGAWRNRCQHTSWYNEPLNTAYRGSRREFPAVAVLVVTGDSLYIYDGDDPTLPFWMRAYRSSGVHSYSWSTIFTDAASILDVTAINGTIITAHNGDHKGLHWIKFIEDAAYTIPDTYWGYGKFNGNIAQRNQLLGYSILDGNMLLTGNGANAVAATVLPGAPIDPATGLPTPTIAVATAGGINILHNSFKLAYITESGGDAYKTVAWTPSGGLMYSSTGYFISIDPQYVPGPGSSATQATMNNLGQLRLYQYDATVPAVSVGWNSPLMDKVVPMKNSVTALDRHDGGGLTLLDESRYGPDRSTNMVSMLTSSYNTGWMLGGVYGAWLSDITQETIQASELLINADGSSTTGWSAGAGNTLTSTGGNLKAVSSTGDGAYFGQGFKVTAGKTYCIKSTTVNDGTSKTARTYLGTGVGNGDIVSGPSGFIFGSTTFYWQATFTGTVYVWFYGAVGGSGTYILVDSASVQLAEANRSPNYYRVAGMQITGALNKNPVATGAELVGYSGFSTSNYLSQPYSASLDIGTGNFTFTCWFKNASEGGGMNFFDRGGNSVWSMWTAADLQYITCYIAGVGVQTPSGAYRNDIWNHLVITRNDGITYIYVNGVLSNYGSQTGSVGTNQTLYLGYTTTSSLNMSLVRISPLYGATPDQVLTMYNWERPLFAENAKAVIYGTSDALTGLAYDSDTDCLHVGTSSGRSVFNKFRRVDNTTTAVTNSISAVNGLVAEN